MKAKKWNKRKCNKMIKNKTLILIHILAREAKIFHSMFGKLNRDEN